MSLNRQSNATNNHGVKGMWSDTGNCFGEFQPDGSFQTNVPVFVPQCCLECIHLDMGEFGDYGEHLSGPYCERNVWFPTRKGTCVKQCKRQSTLAQG